MTLIDVLRIFTIQLGVMMIVITILIVVRYAMLHRAAPNAGPHLLPLHVATIAAAFIVLAAFGIAEIVLRIGEPATWRTPVLFIGYSLANVAQSVMYSAVKAHAEAAGEGPPPRRMA